jgi:hypothetical protein
MHRNDGGWGGRERSPLARRYGRDRRPASAAAVRAPTRPSSWGGGSEEGGGDKRTVSRLGTPPDEDADYDDDIFGAKMTRSRQPAQLPPGAVVSSHAPPPDLAGVLPLLPTHTPAESPPAPRRVASLEPGPVPLNKESEQRVASRAAAADAVGKAKPTVAAPSVVVQSATFPGIPAVSKKHKKFSDKCDDRGTTPPAFAPVADLSANPSTTTCEQSKREKAVEAVKTEPDTPKPPAFNHAADPKQPVQPRTVTPPAPPPEAPEAAAAKDMAGSQLTCEPLMSQLHLLRVAQATLSTHVAESDSQLRSLVHEVTQSTGSALWHQGSRIDLLERRAEGLFAQVHSMKETMESMQGHMHVHRERLTEVEVRKIRVLGGICGRERLEEGAVC